jgi:hypothetical protein
MRFACVYNETFKENNEFVTKAGTRIFICHVEMIQIADSNEVMNFRLP